MKIEAHTTTLVRDLNHFADRVQKQVEQAMAETFLNCVLANFGATGQYRPAGGWSPLSPKYAKKVGRSYATLEVSGRLKESIHVDFNRHFEVTADDSRVPYSTVHQFGGGNNIPPREYFPMHDDGTVYWQVEDVVAKAASAKLAELLN